MKLRQLPPEELANVRRRTQRLNAHTYTYGKLLMYRHDPFNKSGDKYVTRD